MARRYEAELLVLHVVVPDRAAPPVESRAETAAAGDRTRTKVVVHANPATAIIETAHDERADVVVVGNVGLKSRRRFLVGNVPDAVVHGCRCTVVVVDTES
jgi:nucleotide-binding universal stress UspA family protein